LESDLDEVVVSFWMRGYWERWRVLDDFRIRSFGGFFFFLFLFVLCFSSFFFGILGLYFLSYDYMGMQAFICFVSRPSGLLLTGRYPGWDGHWFGGHLSDLRSVDSEDGL